MRYDRRITWWKMPPLIASLPSENLQIEELVCCRDSSAFHLALSTYCMLRRSLDTKVYLHIGTGPLGGGCSRGFVPD
jgi:hypothetical protein